MKKVQTVSLTDRTSHNTWQLCPYKDFGVKELVRTPFSKLAGFLWRGKRKCSSKRLRTLSSRHWNAQAVIVFICSVIGNTWMTGLKSYPITLCILRLPWLARCGMWNFLRDTEEVHRTTHSLHYLFIILCIFNRGATSGLVQLIK
jgi:hypothetical protein